MTTSVSTFSPSPVGVSRGSGNALAGTSSGDAFDPLLGGEASFGSTLQALTTVEPSNTDRLAPSALERPQDVVSDLSGATLVSTPILSTEVPPPTVSWAESMLLRTAEAQAVVTNTSKDTTGAFMVTGIAPLPASFASIGRAEATEAAAVGESRDVGLGTGHLAAKRPDVLRDSYLERRANTLQAHTTPQLNAFSESSRPTITATMASDEPDFLRPADPQRVAAVGQVSVHLTKQMEGVKTSGADRAPASITPAISLGLLPDQTRLHDHSPVVVDATANTTAQPALTLESSQAMVVSELSEKTSTAFAKGLNDRESDWMSRQLNSQATHAPLELTRFAHSDLRASPIHEALAVSMPPLEIMGASISQQTHAFERANAVLGSRHQEVTFSTDASLPTFTIGESVDGDGFAYAVGARITVMVRDGVQEARLHLHPSELGPVTVKIEVDGNAARIDFLAQAPMTRQSLESSMPSLAASLREHGLTLTGGGVHQQASGQQGQPGQPQSQSPQPSTAWHHSDDGLTTASTAAPVVTRITRGLIDLMA